MSFGELFQYCAGFLVSNPSVTQL